MDHGPTGCMNPGEERGVSLLSFFSNLKWSCKDFPQFICGLNKKIIPYNYSDCSFRAVSDLDIPLDMSWLSSLLWEGILVSDGCCNKYHKLGGLKQQKFIISQLWR